MKSLTKEGQQALNAIAAKYDVKIESAERLVNAIIQGNGSMAQFNIPELGGSGQWMKGGMTMVGDMFNHALKAKVDNLCTELSEIASTKLIFEDHEDGMVAMNSHSSSWPADFGSPTSSGAQNNFKYAYFEPAKRLVIDDRGVRKIYDTKHHRISGVSQQQGSSRSYQFTSQEGPVDVDSLSVISDPEEHTQQTPAMPYDVAHGSVSPVENQAQSPEDIIIATIGKINLLFERGQITEQEFKAKKQELLAKL